MKSPGCLLMSKEEKNKMVPKLRFPEFKDSGDWEDAPLESLCSNVASGKDRIDISGDYDLYGSTGIIGKTNDCSYEGDYILVARVGANAGLLTRTNGKFGVTDNTLVIFLKPTENIDFIYSTLERFGLNKLVFGSGQPLITGGQLKNLIVLFPKPKEQQKIADCLSSLDEFITAQNQKFEALKAHKKGLMQQLFPVEGETVPQLRFAEFRDSGEWEEGEVADLADTVMGNAFKSSDFVEEGVQLVRMGNLYQGELNLDRTPVFLPINFDEEHSRFLVKPLDLLMSMTGTVGKRDYGFIVQIPEDCTLLLLNQRVVKIVPKENCIKEFILQLLKSDDFLKQLYSRPGGTKQANLSVQQLIKITIKFPKPKEQQKIADCLSSLDVLITAQAEKIEALKVHKKGLMEGLFPQVSEL